LSILFAPANDVIIIESYKTALWQVLIKGAKLKFRYLLDALRAATIARGLGGNDKHKLVSVCLSKRACLTFAHMFLQSC
jgi:hypothetical protein